MRDGQVLSNGSSCSGSSSHGSSGRAGQVADVIIRKGVTHSEKASEFFMHLYIPGSQSF